MRSLSNVILRKLVRAHLASLAVVSCGAAVLGSLTTLAVMRSFASETPSRRLLSKLR